ncbi:MAG TPA: acetylxylan esterase [Abditibacteriaceae bacterium]|jgi:cephalosporin-C deacetylase-like acetyl esterase
MHKLLLIISVMVSTAPCFGQQITVGAAKPGGVYEVGEKIVWRLGVDGEGAASIDKIAYVLKKGMLTEMGRGELTLKNNVAELETKLDEPGSIFVEFTATLAGKTPIKNSAGAVVAPSKIQPSAPRPLDFDAFWQAKIRELATVPARPVLEPGESGNEAVEYSKLTLDNIRGTKIRGQLARPKMGGKLPALLIVQWAGVYPLSKDWATSRAREGWLTLNINAHDLPIDAPAEFYKQQAETTLKDYPAIGNENRDTSYFLRMYLSCYRAADYLAGRSDWDGKTLVVMGGSQGGLQAIMTAGLHPKITALLANVPAGADQTGPLVGRQPGWPMWYYQTRGKDSARVIETSKYFDVVNFASRVKCPALVGVGLIDTVCPPHGVIAAFNQLQGPKELLVMERSDHQGQNNTQAVYYERSTQWLRQIAAGNPPKISTMSTLPNKTLPPRMPMTTEQDHQRMMRLLGIRSLRPGPSGDPNAPNAANTDESKANPYPNLPDPLVLKDGRKVTTAETWWNVRRPEIIEDFNREIYGRVPENLPRVNWEVTGTTREMNGDVPVVTRQLVGHVDNSSYPLINVDIRLTLTTPANAAGPVPVMMTFGFNFPRGGRGAPGGPPGVAPAGPTWQQQVLAKGWGYAVLIPTSYQADNGAGLTQGIIGLVNKGQPRKVDDWGALRAWAWGASRALDYFETDKFVDARQVGIEGLSRYGKAALVAMAYDPRFAIGFIGSSGEGGAKLHRRNFGEMVENVASSGEYHWMAGNFIKYAGPLTANDLPVDSHQLIALCAPRPVFISVGSPQVEGNWIDSRGQFMAAVAAGPVYRILGKKNLGTTEMPAIETPLIDGDLAFRQHSGGHTTGPNWPSFLTFAVRYIKGPPLTAAPVMLSTRD